MSGASIGVHGDFRAAAYKSEGYAQRAPMEREECERQGASLVAQGLRLRAPRAEGQLPSLVRGLDATCHK